MTAWMRELRVQLFDLVLPAPCAGCGLAGAGQLCGACLATLRSLRPGDVAPRPAPPGLPRCVALGPYEAELRSLLLAYKERGAYLLARPLGAALGAGVAAAVADPARPVALVGVPSSRSAARERHGDHVSRLAGHAASSLRRSGWSACAVRGALRAARKADSSHLDAAARAAAAAGAFSVRAPVMRRLASAEQAGVAVLIVDDIITTGATISSISTVMRDAGVTVHAAVTLAATRRRLAARRPVTKGSSGTRA